MSSPRENTTQITSSFQWIQGAEKVAFLLSDLRPRDTNPEGYDEKVGFWSRAILESSSSGRCIFAIRMVREGYAKDGVLPSFSCLQTITATLLCQGKIRPKSDLEADLSTDIRNSWTVLQVSTWLRVDFQPSQDHCQHL